MSEKGSKSSSVIPEDAGSGVIAREWIVAQFISFLVGRQRSHYDCLEKAARLCVDQDEDLQDP